MKASINSAFFEGKRGKTQFLIYLSSYSKKTDYLSKGTLVLLSFNSATEQVIHTCIT